MSKGFEHRDELDAELAFEHEDVVEIGDFPQPGKRTLTQQIASDGAVLQADAVGTSTDSQAAADLTAGSGRGTPLPEHIRRQWEAVFNTDFSAVRIHEDDAAERIGARAFARGADIHFAPGRFDPDSESGKELLGHELTHVVQQQVGRVSVSSDSVVNADPSLEGEARDLGRRAALGEVVQVRGASALAAPPATASLATASPAGPAASEPAREAPRKSTTRIDDGPVALAATSNAAIQMDGERTVPYGDVSNSRETGAGLALQSRLSSALPAATRDVAGRARDLYVLLPAAAFILEAGLNEAEAADPASRHHYSSYAGTDGVDSGHLGALRLFWEARWVADTESARTAKLRQGRRALGRTLQNSNIRQTIRAAGSAEHAQRDAARVIELKDRNIMRRFPAIQAGEGARTSTRGDSQESAAGRGGGAATTEATADNPYGFPGNRVRRGYRYLGTPTQGRTRQGLTRAAAYFRERNLEDYAIGAETFLRTMSREGYPSAINTWDGMVFTWGTGFAAGGMLPALWSVLDPAVKSALAALAPERCLAAGVRVDPSIRTELATLGAFVQVTEGEHFNTILRAQLRTFLVRTMGLPEQPIEGLHLPVGDGDQLYLSTRLAHHRPGLWNFGTDTARAVALTGGVNPPDDTEYLAACIRVKTQNAIARQGGEGPDGRRLQTRFTDEIFKWRERRIPQWTRGAGGHDAHEVVITDRTRRLCPALTSSTAPYFDSVSTIEEIPANHLVAVEDAIGLDQAHRVQWLAAPRAEKFYDMGPVGLGALSASSGEEQDQAAAAGDDSASDSADGTEGSAE